MPSKLPALQVYLSTEERERVRMAAAQIKASMSEFAKTATMDRVRHIEEQGPMNQAQTNQPVTPKEESEQLSKTRHALMALIECLTWEFNDVPPWGWAVQQVEAALGRDHSYAQDLRKTVHSDWLEEEQREGS